MPTLVERVREVVAAESDDFFGADTILYYLNSAQNKITSYAVKSESQMVAGGSPRKSLRVLDKLRRTQETDITTLSVSATGDYFVTELTFPVDINQFSFLKYKDKTILRELNAFELHTLDWGNINPNVNEGYYYVKNDGTDTLFEIYIHEDLSGGAGATNYIYLHYIKNPTDLTAVSESMTELPDQLENALIYGAAMLMIMQESIENPQAQIDQFKSVFQEELQTNIY